MTGRRDDLPAVLNPTLFVPHLIFTAVGSPSLLRRRLPVPALRVFASPLLVALSSSTQGRCRLPPSFTRIAVVRHWRPRTPPQRERLPVPAPSAIRHTVKLPMESALCAFLVQPTFTIQIRPRSVLKPQSRLLLVSVPAFASPTSTSMFSAARGSSFSSSSDAAVSPSRIGRGAAAAVRVHRRGGQAYAAAALDARMMEADDGESQEHAHRAR
ncbi:hypothetical protein C8R45DRAFT_934166 [Mycena sanguinolenta]|nr:hypothetical protein C8R45DRAFT_934166 [Mycena sanguinolenta]